MSSFQFIAATNVSICHEVLICSRHAQREGWHTRKYHKKKRKSLKLLSECMIMCDYPSACLFFPLSISAGFVFLHSRSHLPSLCPLHLYLCASLRRTWNKMCCPPLSFTAGLPCSKKLKLKITFHYALVNWFSKLIQKILITISLSRSWCFQIASFVQPGVVLQSQMIKNSSKSLKWH